MPRTRPPYPQEVRRDAVELVRAGRSIRDVAGASGVSHQSLRNWSERPMSIMAAARARRRPA